MVRHFVNNKCTTIAINICNVLTICLFFFTFFRSFTEIADKVHRGLLVFYKSFTEQAEFLYQNVLLLYIIGDDVSSFRRRTKIANITGGTTTAVGGVAAIAGLALAPFTLGTSLIISAVGLGVATAGGIAAASATISDNIHEMNVSKTNS